MSILTKVKRLFNRKPSSVEETVENHAYTYEEVKKIIADVTEVAYNDGKRAGIEISKQAAIKGLKESLWHQNNLKKK